MAERLLSRVTRWMKGSDRLDGYIVGVGRKWVLLAIPDIDGSGGYSAVRLRDITTARRIPARFVRRALEFHGAWPLLGPEGDVDLDTTTGLIDTLARLYPLICIFTEYKAPDVCYIGRVDRHRGHKVRISYLTPEAKWNGYETYRHRDISRVDVAGRYETALAHVASGAS